MCVLVAIVSYYFHIEHQKEKEGDLQLFWRWGKWVKVIYILFFLLHSFSNSGKLRHIFLFLKGSLEAYSRCNSFAKRSISFWWAWHQSSSFAHRFKFFLLFIRIWCEWYAEFGFVYQNNNSQEWASLLSDLWWNGRHIWIYIM